MVPWVYYVPSKTWDETNYKKALSIYFLMKRNVKSNWFSSSTYSPSSDFQKIWDMVWPWSSHVWGPKNCKNFGPRWFGSGDTAQKPFLGHFWAIFWVFSKPCQIYMVIAMRLISWPLIELKTRFDLSHQLVPYLATRRLSANCCENLISQFWPCSPVLQKNIIKPKTSGKTYIFW